MLKYFARVLIKNVSLYFKVVPTALKEAFNTFCIEVKKRIAELVRQVISKCFDAIIFSAVQTLSDLKMKKIAIEFIFL
jgi:hypothetical protein